MSKYQYSASNIEDVINNQEEYIIPEILPACKLLWDKGIETYMCGNYEDTDGRWIELANVQEPNRIILDKLIKKDNRYAFGHHYVLRVPFGVNEVQELCELTKPLVSQDTIRFSTLEEYLDSFKRTGGKLIIENDGTIKRDYNPLFENATLEDALNTRNERHLYIKEEDRIYDSELFLEWHNRFLEEQRQKSKIGINEKLFSLKNKEEIISFVKRRIEELTYKSRESIIDLKHCTIYEDFITEDSHYKIREEVHGVVSPDLVFDDIDAYVKIIEQIIESNSWYNELSLFTDVMHFLYEYLPNNDPLCWGRTLFYENKARNGIKKVSIKDVKDEEIAMCSEKAGLAHNIFKLLGIDSKIVIGRRNNENHAYNIVYPKGYDGNIAILYDPSYHINFNKKNNTKRYSFGYFKILSTEEYENLMSGNETEIDVSTSYSAIYKKYGTALGDIADYEITSDVGIYSLGRATNLNVSFNDEKKVLKLKRKKEDDK